MKKTNLEAKFTKSSENFSKLKGKTQNFEKKLKNSSKKLKVSANPLGLLAENRSKKKAYVKPMNSVNRMSVKVIHDCTKCSFFIDVINDVKDYGNFSIDLCLLNRSTTVLFSSPM